MVMFRPRAEHDHNHLVGKWVIMVMFRPRAKHDSIEFHNHPLGDAGAALVVLDERVLFAANAISAPEL